MADDDSPTFIFPGIATDLAGIFCHTDGGS